jgi:hypothetical protein
VESVPLQAVQRLREGGIDRQVVVLDVDVVDRDS